MRLLEFWLAMLASEGVLVGKDAGGDDLGWDIQSSDKESSHC